MKKALLHTLSVLLSLTLFSCQNNSSGIHPEDAGFAVMNNDREFPLDTPQGLDAFIKARIGDRQFEIREASFIEAKDEQGPFYLARARYDHGDKTTSLLISLTPPEKAIYTKTGRLLLNNECIMSCTTALGCDGCTQTAASRCRSQACSCPDQAGCNTSVIFGEETAMAQ
ncbi:MAG: hypothetical protein R2824_24250 [Saprospiraceae bacterium]|nr:hypothetical protein [Lewinella sp.]